MEYLIQFCGKIGMGRILAAPCKVRVGDPFCAFQILFPVLCIGIHRAEIHCRHLAPTPVGMKVTATARLRSMERRKLWFDIEVNDEKGKCGEGSHLRIIVNSKAISEKAANKAENS